MCSFIQPYSFDGNVGKAYNIAVKPLRGWICITDQDTLKFYGFANKVRRIIKNSNKDMLITCKTNRLRKDNTNVLLELYNENDISIHKKKYKELWKTYGTETQRTKEAIPGMFMLFHKSLWDKVKFKENEPNFDNHFTVDVRQAGFTTHVAKGLYIFHLYKWKL